MTSRSYPGVAMGPTEVGTGSASPEAPPVAADSVEHPPGVRERTGVVQMLPMVMTVPAVSAPATEDDLIAGLRRGDRAAVSRAYEAHLAAIRAFAQRLVGDAAATEDIVHDTFVALPAAIRGFRGDAALRTFLIGVAVNHAKRHVRS